MNEGFFDMLYPTFLVQLMWECYLRIFLLFSLNGVFGVCPKWFFKKKFEQVQADLLVRV